MANSDKDKSETKSALAKLVKDEESLLASFEQNPDQACSVIVQAKLPKRKFSFGGNDSKRLVRDEDSASSHEARNKILEQVANQLVRIVGDENTSLLKSAGSIVVTGTPVNLRRSQK